MCVRWPRVTTREPTLADLSPHTASRHRVRSGVPIASPFKILRTSLETAAGAPESVAIASLATTHAAARTGSRTTAAPASITFGGATASGRHRWTRCWLHRAACARCVRSRVRSTSITITRPAPYEECCASPAIRRSATSATRLLRAVARVRAFRRRALSRRRTPTHAGARVVTG